MDSQIITKLLAQRNCSTDTILLFDSLRNLILTCTPYSVEEKISDRFPCYYVGEKYIRLIPFPNNITMEASAIKYHKDELSEYKLTPQRKLQIGSQKRISPIIAKIIEETFTENRNK